MRSTPVLILFGFFVVLIHSRPSHTDNNSESNFEEADYVENKSSDDSPGRDPRIEDSPDGVSQTSGIDMNKNIYSYEQGNIAINRAERTNPDISDLKPYGNRNFRNKVEDYVDTQSYGPRRQAKYAENVDPVEQQEINQRLTNRNLNYPKNKRVHNNMLLEDSLSKLETGLKKEFPNVPGEMLFGARGQDKNEFINEPLEINKPYSRYYGQMQPANKELIIPGKTHEGDHMFYNRERRESNPNPDPSSNVETEKQSDNDQNECEETAIKKHIKKLSSDELEELLSSLSEEKKQLLKSIMDDTDLTQNINDVVNKREITKKAGAVEENSCVISGQPESNISGESAANDSDDKTTEPPSQNNALNITGTGKDTESQPESNAETITESNTEEKTALSVDTAQQNADSLASDVSTVKDLSAEQQPSGEKSVSDLIASDDKTLGEVVPSDDKSPAQMEPGELVTSKVENKRETNIDDLADIVSFEDPKMMDNDWLLEDSKDQCSCSQDEDLSQFIDEDQSAANDGNKIYKRDVQKQADYDAKMKSLEESFPKSSSYDEVAGPLIRVKRKTEPVIKKRAAALLPDSKLSFFPYRAENEDEDNDEGNEFDDDGFYDRTPNFSSNDKSNIRDPSVYKFNLGNSASLKEVSKSTSNLGSDTDSVLSGVEGQDENVMVSSGSRNRRTSDEISDVLDESNSIHNSKSLNDESKPVSNLNNVVTYQESDSFGPLPRHEGESGRYKRIRRVKQSHPDPA